MNVRLDPQDEHDLEALASKVGKEPEVLLREIVHEALVERKRNRLVELRSSEDETLFDALKRHGLIGCIDGLPADLSTNPEHMEGFGRSD